MLYLSIFKAKMRAPTADAHHAICPVSAASFSRQPQSWARKVGMPIPSVRRSSTAS